MRSTTFLTTVISLAIIPIANATTVLFSPSPTARTVVDSTATALDNVSSLVWTGNFTSTAFSLNNALTLQQNITSIQAAGGWEQFGLDTTTGLPNAGVTGGLTISVTGKLGGSIEDDSTGATKADYFNGENLYVWIFNAATTATATEMGIFRATTSTTPWTFPTNAAGGSGDDVALGTTTGAASVIAAIGGVGSASNTQLQLTGVAPVPEPSTFTAAFALALTAMGVRRRRRG